METDLMTLVMQAQMGDKESLDHILRLFNPLLMKQKAMIDLNEQEDLLQSLKEIIILKTLNYEVDKIPNFSEFQLLIDDQRKWSD